MAFKRLSANESLKELQSTLDACHRRPAGAILTVALACFEGKDVLLSARMIFKDQPTEARPQAKYSNIILVEEWIESLEAALDRVENIVMGSGTVSDHSIQASFSKQWEIDLNRRSRRYTVSGWYEWVLVGDYAPTPQIPLNDPAVAFGLPPYRTCGEAVSEWVWGERRTEAIRLGKFLVVVPDTRGRMAAAEWSVNGEVNVELELNVPRQEVEVQAYFEHSTERDRSFPAPDRNFSFSAPSGTNSISLYLVHSSGTQLSDATLSSFEQTPTPDEENGDNPITTHQRADQDIQGGEGIEVEFKPFIMPKNEKESEIVRTIVAFANTQGGRIYFGITEKAGLTQGTKALIEAYKTPPPKAREEFEAHLRKLIGDKINGSGLKYGVDVIEYRGEPVGVLTIERGKNPPYSTSEDEVLIRKNSTNKRPAAQTELVQLCLRRQSNTELNDSPDSY